MITGAVMITLSCVLFVQMGLADAIQDVLGFRLTLISCPKCLTYWSVLAYAILSGRGFLECVAVPFISAYAALWVALAYDCLTTIYNKFYEHISETTDTEEDGNRAHEAETDAADAVS